MRGRGVRGGCAARGAERTGAATTATGNGAGARATGGGVTKATGARGGTAAAGRGTGETIGVTATVGGGSPPRTDRKTATATRPSAITAALTRSHGLPEGFPTAVGEVTGRATACIVSGATGAIAADHGLDGGVDIGSVPCGVTIPCIGTVPATLATVVT